MVAVVYEELPNEVMIYDVERGREQSTKPIMFPKGY